MTPPFRKTAWSLIVPILLTVTPLRAAEPKPLVRFAAMGDVPYAPEEDLLLPKQIAGLPAEAEFVIHVGDIKQGKVACTEDIYSKVAGMLSTSKPPVFIIPGDNEWNDCGDPDDAWKMWDQHFMHFDKRWEHDFDVARQKNRPENFSFTRGGVLFIGLNLLGGRVHDQLEWEKRHRQNLRWVQKTIKQAGDNISSVVIFGHARPAGKHDDFFSPFVKFGQEFDKPILYLHGDGHVWIYDRPFAAKNILRVQVDRGGIASPLLVTVTDDPRQPFLFDRRQPEVDAAAVAAAILDDTQPEKSRQTLIKNNGQAAVEILQAMIADLQVGTQEQYRRIPWIWRVTVAAGKRRNTDEIARILDVALPPDDAPLLDWQTVVIGGGMISGITTGGEWPHKKLAGLWYAHPELKVRFDRALELAAAMANDETVPTPTRYDALRMLALRPWEKSSEQLNGYLAAGTDAELQQGAISALGDMPSPSVAEVLLSAYPNYTQANRGIALDALLRDNHRITALLDAIEAGKIPKGDLDEERIKKMKSVADKTSKRRMNKLLDR